jgi:hypothetical protein
VLERARARLGETEAAPAAFAYGSVAVRLAGVLLRLAGQAPAGVVHASHGELAAQVGSHHETVNTLCVGSEREGWSRLAATASGRAIWPVSSDWWAAEASSAQEAAEW